MVLGTVLLIGALSLFLWNTQEDLEAGQASVQVITQLGTQIHSPAPGETEAALPDPFDPEMDEMEVDGNLYIGYLSIPSWNLELPIMSDWSYDQLRIAPCRFSGSTKTDNLVLMAHNYPQHFGNLKDLQIGDTISFMDVNGIVSHYEVVLTEVLDPTLIEEMTAADYDLTLFTCTYTGKYRVTVRCDRAK